MNPSRRNRWRSVKNQGRKAAPFWLLVNLLVGAGVSPLAAEVTPPFGLATHQATPAYLSMPEEAGGLIPRRLSETGAFSRTADLRIAPGLIPYALHGPIWSDGAAKTRWVAVPGSATEPGSKVRFAATGPWTFPPGTVFVKHFDLALDENHPEATRRLETRLLVCDRTGGVYGVVYKWRADGTDADLLATNLTETLVIRTTTGTRTQNWYYPSRADCRMCHTEKAGGVLGLKTAQLNGEMIYPGGISDNQLRAWNHAGLFLPALSEGELAGLPRLARGEDESRSLEDRARSFLDANCAQCHRPEGTVANFDARYEIPLARQHLINAPVLIDEGVDGARVVAPNDIWRSILFLRAGSLEGMKMPPLAHETIDTKSLTLLRRWIESLPGPPVLAPPVLSPAGGDFRSRVIVTITAPDPRAIIHYTLDGSVPTKSDPVYQGPISLTAATVVRAKAYQTGFTKSITAQAVFIVGE